MAYQRFICGGVLSLLLAGIATPLHAQVSGSVTPLSSERTLESGIPDHPPDTQTLSGLGAFQEGVRVWDGFTVCIPGGGDCFTIPTAESFARQNSWISQGADGVLQIDAEGEVRHFNAVHTASRVTSTFAVDGVVPYTMQAGGDGAAVLTLTDAAGNVLVAHRAFTGQLSDIGRLPTGTYTLAVEMLDTPTGRFDVNFAVGGALASSPPRCMPRVEKRSYTFGEVARGAFSLHNFGPTTFAIELKTWIRFPNGLILPARSGGADGSLFMPAATTMDAQVDLFGVGPEIPPGTYAFGCRLLDPATGERLDERLYVFVVQ